MKNTHPYTKYQNSIAWIQIEKILQELIDNQDIQITTSKEYVIGFLCKKLVTIKNKKID